MSKEFNGQEKEIKTKELFLKIFQEKGVSTEELKEAICKSYIDEVIEHNINKVEED